MRLELKNRLYILLGVKRSEVHDFSQTFGDCVLIIELGLEYMLSGRNRSGYLMQFAPTCNRYVNSMLVYMYVYLWCYFKDPGSCMRRFVVLVSLLDWPGCYSAAEDDNPQGVRVKLSVTRE